MENENEFGEYKEHFDEFINSLTAQKADSQKELEKERAMKQKPDKETQKLRVKVTDSEAKLADAGATGASIAKLKAKQKRKKHKTQLLKLRNKLNSMPERLKRLRESLQNSNRKSLHSTLILVRHKPI
ncbi:hypothetical protein EIN_104750 [Entamoeba invadens IP1]|uniref:Uncharacterized protein n=1 Tax=Entamoeba invadens IP1 TaxID=370355 RepID=L7FMF6_ENTIV|nr:hypothetical protein EIN_104750 [Entamoeba invadens IP1]ELP88742.1 hypothetical protein EIN_104750 [Entamoeba invadens IP1]|eukprot:XP_004255513.1 hypothetical protein EIN_104750 [Entamoeba invadens IP1]